MKIANSCAAIFMNSATERGASTLTKVRMHTTFLALEKCALEKRWRDHTGKLITPASINEKHLARFVAHRIKQGIAPRSVQNEMSHVRRALHGAGRGEFADRLTNADLGVPAGTRIGTGKVVDPGIFAQALASAGPETRAWAVAQHELGLRVRELVRAGPSLQAWERQIRTGQSLQLHDGGKGGKSRQIFIPPEKREAALQAVQALQEVAKAQGGHVVPSETLRQACKLVSARYAAVGLSGDNSSHSLRRAFAAGQVAYYEREGYTRKEALGLAAIDLGHGDTRGRWIYNNYLRATEEAT